MERTHVQVPPRCTRIHTNGNVAVTVTDPADGRRAVMPTMSLANDASARNTATCYRIRRIRQAPTIADEDAEDGVTDAIMPGRGACTAAERVTTECIAHATCGARGPRPRARARYG